VQFDEGSYARRELLRVEVQLTGGLSDTLVLREGDSVDAAVQRFAWRHALAPAYAPVLAHTIARQLADLNAKSSLPPDHPNHRI
jgi:hypothetical protein